MLTFLKFTVNISKNLSFLHICISVFFLQKHKNRERKDITKQKNVCVHA